MFKMLNPGEPGIK